MSSVKSIGILGAGQMGRGIAQVAIMSGYEVYLYDAYTESLDKGLSFVEYQLKRGVEKGKWTGDLAEEALRRLKLKKALEELKNCDLIVEAATENKEVKFKLFQECDKLIKKEAILVSNTSSISITEIAAQTERPQQIAGMHFMNPVPVMKLVEGIRGLETSNKTFEVVAGVAEKMGPLPRFVRHPISKAKLTMAGRGLQNARLHNRN